MQRWWTKRRNDRREQEKKKGAPKKVHTIGRARGKTACTPTGSRNRSAQLSCGRGRMGCCGLWVVDCRCGRVWPSSSPKRMKPNRAKTVVGEAAQAAPWLLDSRGPWSREGRRQKKLPEEAKERAVVPYCFLLCWRAFFSWLLSPFILHAAVGGIKSIPRDSFVPNTRAHSQGSRGRLANTSQQRRDGARSFGAPVCCCCCCCWCVLLFRSCLLLRRAGRHKQRSCFDTSTACEGGIVVVEGGVVSEIAKKEGRKKKTQERERKTRPGGEQKSKRARSAPW
jgi:hypothetical protein